MTESDSDREPVVPQFVLSVPLGWEGVLLHALALKMCPHTRLSRLPLYGAKMKSLPLRDARVTW
jgi:hypothetical protein